MRGRVEGGGCDHCSSPSSLSGGVGARARVSLLLVMRCDAMARASGSRGFVHSPRRDHGRLTEHPPPQQPRDGAARRPGSCRAAARAPRRAGHVGQGDAQEGAQAAGRDAAAAGRRGRLRRALGLRQLGRARDLRPVRRRHGRGEFESTFSLSTRTSRRRDREGVAGTTGGSRPFGTAESKFALSLSTRDEPAKGSRWHD